MVVTLALGIGANAAIFSVVRGVLLRPLVNRDEDRLIYIRQSAPGLGADEHDILGARDQRLQIARHDRSAPSATSPQSTSRMVGLVGEPRMVKAGVVGGSFFEVMGLRPVLGRLIERGRRRPEGGGRGGADLSLLDDLAQ